MLFRSLFSLFAGHKEKISIAKSALEEVEADIGKASLEKDYASLGELAQDAEAKAQSILRMEECFAESQALLEAIRDNAPDVLKDRIEAYDPDRHASAFGEDCVPESFPLDLGLMRGGFLESRDQDDEKQHQVDDDALTPPADNAIELPVTPESLPEASPSHSEKSESLGEEELTATNSNKADPDEICHASEGESGLDQLHAEEASSEDTIDADELKPEPCIDVITPPVEEETSLTDLVPLTANQLEETISTQNPAPVSNEVFAHLISRDFVGIATEVAEAFELQGQSLPLPASVLRVAAASRAPHSGYGPDVQELERLVVTAQSERLSDNASALLLGAILKPALMTSSTQLRSQAPAFCQGTGGQHLIELADTISQLDYAFPPRPDDLAEISGHHGVPQKQRIAKRLEAWCEACSKKSSRWPFATEFMHYVASDQGPIGAATKAIISKGKNAIELVRHATESLDTASKIEDYSEEYSSKRGYNDLSLYSKGVEYLVRQFDEPIGLLKSWLSATTNEGATPQQSADKVRITVNTLRNQLKKALEGLTSEGDKTGSPLDTAIFQWVADQLGYCDDALIGEDTGAFSSLDEALTAERDLLPPGEWEEILDSANPTPIYQRILEQNLILGPEEALKRAIMEGAFDTAMRMIGVFDLVAGEDIGAAISDFVGTWRPEIQKRDRRLTALEKVDFKNQEEIYRQVTWCKLTLSQLDDLGSKTKLHDVVGLHDRLTLVDEKADHFESTIREDQKARIAEYRKTDNEEDVQSLLEALGGLTIEAIEDRIAQLRDGRSAAVFDTDLDGMIAGFVPEFINFSASKSWPRSLNGFKEATSEVSNPLFIEEDRRASGIEFIDLYLNMMATMRSKKPAIPQIRELFEEIGFENVKINNLSGIGRKKGSWTATMTAKIETDGWFLPPIFGSNASAGYVIYLISPETLPETVVKSIPSGKPSIIMLAGVVDASRRLEFAERLRSTAKPALLIDEALIAFTATKRETRARTVFECGLPYGRVEPYTTDAGNLPREMFFGRKEEIRKILDRTADGCLVYGGRQLGKSVLLSHVSNTHHEPNQDRYIFNMVIKPLGDSEETSKIWRDIAGILPDEILRPGSLGAEEVTRDIIAWLNRHPGGQIICLFDEADNFMAKDTRDGYRELTKLKDLMEKTQRAFKVVFAGLHNVQRMHNQPNSPLWHLGEPICIGPLNRTIDDKRAAFDLVVSPMRAAGFGFEKRESVEEILAWANYYPSLVQEYMKGLLATLHGSGSGKPYKLSGDGPLWKIKSDELFNHRGFEEIESRIRKKFHMTLDLDPRYALIAYTLARLIADGEERSALVTGLTPDQLLSEAVPYWPETSEEPNIPAFEVLLEELFDLGVLGRRAVADTRNRFTYLLRTREVAAMLGTGADISQALDRIQKTEPSSAYDRVTHRRRYPAKPNLERADWSYAPLTDHQIEQLTLNDNSPLQIICGLEILGLNKVASSLKRISEVGNFPGIREADQISVEEAASESELRRIVDRKRPSKDHVTILIYQPNEVNDVQRKIDWLEKQQSVLSRAVRPLIILSATNSDLRSLANRRLDQSQFLMPWSAEMIRVHLDELEKTHLDTRELRHAILEATGGIPSEVQKLIMAMIQSEAPAETAANWSINASLPVDFFDEVVQTALTILDMDGSYADKNEMLYSETGKDFETIGPDLRATGTVSGRRKKDNPFVLSSFGRFLANSVT